MNFRLLIESHLFTTTSREILVADHGEEAEQETPWQPLFSSYHFIFRYLYKKELSHYCLNTVSLFLGNYSEDQNQSYFDVYRKIPSENPHEAEIIFYPIPCINKQIFDFS